MRNALLILLLCVYSFMKLFRKSFVSFLCVAVGHVSQREKVLLEMYMFSQCNSNSSIRVFSLLHSYSYSGHRGCKEGGERYRKKIQRNAIYRSAYKWIATIKTGSELIMFPYRAIKLVESWMSSICNLIIKFIRAPTWEHLYLISLLSYFPGQWDL